MVSVHTLVAAVCCTGPVPAIEIWAELYHKTPSDASYLVSVVVRFLYMHMIQYLVSDAYT